jgi:tetratricopeptide (TPR) repeat protein
MSFLGKLFGKKEAPLPQPPADPAKDPNMIRVFDAYGREMFITKQAWRDSVLLGHIKKVWNDPAALYSTIVQALQDGFGADMIKPAEQLAKIDPDAERGAIVLAIVYREQKRTDDSEKVLRRHIERHGESGVVLTNLAKVEADRGDNDQSLKTLWRGLELDPNQDNGLGWYEVIHREKDGAAAGVAALRRIAALPNSWRARLWLARDALSRKQLDEACALYNEALAMTPRPVPTDMLQQISGDLGNYAHLPELLRITEPHFDIQSHGLAVGNNLIKANLDLGRFDTVRALLESHYSQKRPDWKETLSYWETELTKAQLTIADSSSPVSIAMLQGEGPVWLPDDSPAVELFPAPTGESVRIAFLGSSAETTIKGDKPQHQMSDAPGRVSRALPLFLAEQVRFGGSAHVRTLVPWLQGDTPAFVLAGMPWRDEDAAQHARAGSTPADYVVVTHLRAGTEPWQIELCLIRTIDAKRLATANASFQVNQSEQPIRALAIELLSLLTEHADFAAAQPPPVYVIPTGGDFPAYLIRLEQLLAVRCSSMPGASASFLTNDRDIVDGNLHLCVAHPSNVIARIVLLQTLLLLKKVRPVVVEEYREKVLLLQKEKPLTGVAVGVTQRLAAEIYP